MLGKASRSKLNNHCQLIVYKEISLGKIKHICPEFEYIGMRSKNDHNADFNMTLLGGVEIVI